MRPFIRLSRTLIRCVAVVEDSQVDVSFRFIRSINLSLSVFSPPTPPCHLTGCVVECWLCVQSPKCVRSLRSEVMCTEVRCDYPLGRECRTARSTFSSS